MVKNSAKVKNNSTRIFMKIKITCLKCGFSIDKDIEIEIESNRFAEALKFLNEHTQKHHHREINDSFKWRVGWEGIS
jgi:hypothetical protein